LALIACNTIVYGRAAFSPFGNVFVLARLLADGPAQRVLTRECPSAGWRLCAFRDRLPTSADDILWDGQGPIIRAGGAKLVSREADAIITAAVAAEPMTVFASMLGNGARQLTLFATGDGMEPWPLSVSPVIARDFPPAEFAAYAAARQTQGQLAVPDSLQMLHRLVALAGMAGCLAGAVIGLRRRLASGAFCAAVLAALVANALITGSLSGPHDRYQARVIWLAPLATLLAWRQWRRPREQVSGPPTRSATAPDEARLLAPSARPSA
jgi:hypothetical protein